MSGPSADPKCCADEEKKNPKEEILNCLHFGIIVRL
jgi:hypothetical protein